MRKGCVNDQAFQYSDSCADHYFIGFGTDGIHYDASKMVEDECGCSIFFDIGMILHQLRRHKCHIPRTGHVPRHIQTATV